jgi:hypothetical protein
MIRALVLLSAVAACGGAAGHAPAEPTASPAPPPPTAQTDTPLPHGEAASQAGPPLDEVTARVLLSDRFRRAGYRIRHDVRLVVEENVEVTLDGFDPERRVGFEYVSPEEVGVAVAAAEIAALRRAPDLRVLVIEPTDEAGLAAQADAFLAALAGAADGDDD